METFEVRTARTEHAHAVVRGGAGPTLVYFHGFFGVETDEPIARELSAEFDVVAPLHPGFKDLQELDDIWDVHDLAFHYDDLLEAMGLVDINLIGHSYGAMVAAELAAHVPSRVSRLMLVSPLGLWRDQEPALDIFRAYPARLDSLLWSGDAPQKSDSEPEAPDLDALLSMAQGMTSTGKFMWPLPDKGLERRLHRVRAQTSIVWGSADELVPRSYAEAFVSSIPNAELTVLEGASHMLPLARKDDFKNLVHDFFGA